MIEVQNLYKYYGDFCAVSDISFSIKKGEITGLLGPNGAGKSTTMRMITGYLSPASGKITVGEKNIADEPIAVKKMIGYLPESAPLYQDMMVYDYLHYAARIHDVDSEERVRETAFTCGLIEVMHKNISELSKGYRQRVGLAHAMIHDPAILILDEPTTGLDPNQIIEIRNLIKKIGKEKTVILSTHILSEVEATCDRVIIIDSGKIVVDGNTAEVQRAHRGSVSVKLTVTGASAAEISTALAAVEGVAGVRVLSEDSAFVSLAVAAAAESEIRPQLFAAIVAKGWVLYEMVREQNTLEEIFRELTSGGNNE